MTKPIQVVKTKMIKLYTKSGDKGESGLGRGERLLKSDLVFEVLGTIDELNTFIGLAVSEATNTKQEKLRRELQRVQNMLLNCGAVVGSGKDTTVEIEREVAWLEKKIDKYQAGFGDDWYKRFLLPGGTELAARIDVCRAVCRRAERVLVRLGTRAIEQSSGW